MSLRFVLLAVLALAITSAPTTLRARPPSGMSPEVLVRNLFERRCTAGGCHGVAAPGRRVAQTDFGSILDRAALVRSGVVVPRDPSRSLLLQQIESAEMPLRGPALARDERALVRAWIAAGAPDWTPRAPSPDGHPRRVATDRDLLAAVLADLSALPALDRPFVRYFSLAPVHNRGVVEAELDSLREALAFTLNSLSWRPSLVAPTALAPARALVRIDLRRLGWTRETWSAIVRRYPFGALPLGAGASSAAAMMALGDDERVPWVRADWFITEATRPPLYDQVLGMPATDRALEARLGVDVPADEQTYTARRAGFVTSGVSRNNRLIERHDADHGAYWRSYDFSDSVGAHNVLQNPLGPGASAHRFVPSGGEIIFHLPNGLQAYMLVNARGARIDAAPIEIVSDPGTPGDPVIRSGVSCIACHGLEGVRDRRDDVRPFVLASANLFTALEREQVAQLYPLEGEFLELVQRDRARYRAALDVVVPAAHRGAGPTLGVVAWARRFADRLDRDTVAAELGLAPALLVARVERSTGTLRTTLGPLLTPGQTLPRDAFVCAFQDLARELDPDVVFEPARSPSLASCPAPGAAAVVADPAVAPAGTRDASSDEPRCAAGELPACVRAGLALANGTEVARDYARARQLQARACAGGNLDGCNDLAVLHQNGWGAPRDYPQAAALFQRACTGGIASACNNLGVIYLNGWGVANDNTHAAALFSQACDAGSRNGCMGLGQMLQYGVGVARDEPRAAALYARACGPGVPRACELAAALPVR